MTPAPEQADPGRISERRLFDLIDRYLLAVSEAFSAFLDAGICSAPGGQVEWAANGIDHSGRLPNGGRYQKLAYGLFIERNGLSVAFDFGAEGETHEFDAFRLNQFCTENSMSVGFRNEAELEVALAQARAANKLRITPRQRLTLA